MPLKKSRTNKARVQNYQAERAAGKPPNVAWAIAYSVQRRARARRTRKKG